MNKTHSIRIRITERDWERLQNRANQFGFSSVSAFIRKRTLSDDIFLEGKLNKLIQIMERDENAKDNPMA